MNIIKAHKQNPHFEVNNINILIHIKFIYTLFIVLISYVEFVQIQWNKTAVSNIQW